MSKHERRLTTADIQEATVRQFHNLVAEMLLRSLEAGKRQDDVSLNIMKAAFVHPAGQEITVVSGTRQPQIRVGTPLSSEAREIAVERALSQRHSHIDPYAELTIYRPEPGGTRLKSRGSRFIEYWTSAQDPLSGIITQGQVDRASYVDIVDLGQTLSVADSVPQLPSRSI